MQQGRGTHKPCTVPGSRTKKSQDPPGNRNMSNKSEQQPADRQNLTPEELATLSLCWESWEQAVSTPARRIVRAKLHLVFLLVRYGGLRLREVLEMPVTACLDRQSGLLSVPGENARDIMLPMGCMQHFRRILSLPEAEQADFLALDTGFIRRKFYAVAELCGLPPQKAAPRALRYARGLELLSLHVPLSMVQKYLGQPGAAKTFFLNFAGGDVKSHVLDRARERSRSRDNVLAGIVTSIRLGLRRAELEISVASNLVLYAQTSLDRVQDLDLGEHRQVISFHIPSSRIVLTLDHVPTSLHNCLEATVTGLHADSVEGFASTVLCDGTPLHADLDWGRLDSAELYEGRRVWLHFAASSVEIDD